MPQEEGFQRRGGDENSTRVFKLLETHSIMGGEPMTSLLFACWHDQEYFFIRTPGRAFGENLFLAEK